MKEQIIRESMKGDIIYNPKFLLNEGKDDAMDIVPKFPINKPFKYSQEKLIKAIQNGMIMSIIYKGEEDDSPGGHERVITPLVLGKNINTQNILVRGWHLEGYSVGLQKDTEKVWRLFNVKNIISMTFTGNFLRMPPKNYVMNDRVMTEKTIMRADFNQIRRNQNKLIQIGKIESEEETKIAEKLTIAQIEIKNTDTQIDLRIPWDNILLKKFKNKPKEVKISILKSVLGNEYICLVGAIGTVNRSVKIFVNKRAVGTYKTVAAFTGDEFSKYRNVRNISIFDLYEFIGKK